MKINKIKTKKTAVGALIKKYRKMNKLTQVAFSEMTGIDRQLIARWETCYSCPSNVSMQLLKMKNIIE